MFIHVVDNPAMSRPRLAARERGLPDRLRLLSPEQIDLLFGQVDPLLREHAITHATRSSPTSPCKQRVLLNTDSSDHNAVMAVLDDLTRAPAQVPNIIDLSSPGN